MSTDIHARYRHIIGDATDWNTNNIVIGDGEIALIRDAGKIRAKIGDGTTPFNTLDWAFESGAGGGTGDLKSDGSVLMAPGYVGAQPQSVITYKQLDEGLNTKVEKQIGHRLVAQLEVDQIVTNKADLTAQKLLIDKNAADITGLTGIKKFKGTFATEAARDVVVTAPVDGDYALVGLGPVYQEWVYDRGGWEKAGNTSAALTLDYATSAEVQTGTVDVKVVNPKELKKSFTDGLMDWNLHTKGTGQFDGGVGIGRSAAPGYSMIIKRSGGGRGVSITDLTDGASPGAFEHIITNMGSGGVSYHGTNKLTKATDPGANFIRAETAFSGVTTKQFNVDYSGNIYAKGTGQFDGALTSLTLSAGAVTATAGGLIQGSDTRIKSDFADGTHHIDDFDTVETGHFNYLSDEDTQHFGFKAQSLPEECVSLTDQVVPEHEDLYYEDVETLNPDYDEEDPDSQQYITERQRNDVPFDDEHRVKGVNLGATLAKVVSHNQLLKQKLIALEARLNALEDDD